MCPFTSGGIFEEIPLADPPSLNWSSRKLTSFWNDRVSCRKTCVNVSTVNSVPAAADRRLSDSSVAVMCVNVGWPDHRVCCFPTYWLFCGTLTLIRVMSTVLLWLFVHYPKWGVGKIPFIVIINRESRLVYSYLSCGRSHPCIIASIGGRCLSSLKLTLSISIFRWTLQPCMGCTN